MSKQPFKELPNIPQEIENAAQSGELVVFVGAGISRLVKCPSWDQFADRVLEQIVKREDQEGIDYYELSQIQKISDPKKKLSLAKIIINKKKLSINYDDIFKTENSIKNNIYDFLNRFDSSFVTTNYDKLLSPALMQNRPSEEWRFYKKDDLLGANLDKQGAVIHLHGCVADPQNMIITTKDYLDHYSSDTVHDFLKYLFEKKIVLFLGYGLEETEILEYILRRGNEDEPKSDRARRFILQGFFNAEKQLFELLKEYYFESFNTELIGFQRDLKDFAQQIAIIESWSKNLNFGYMTLADEVSAIEDEISG